MKQFRIKLSRLLFFLFVMVILAIFLYWTLWLPFSNIDKAVTAAAVLSWAFCMRVFREVPHST